MKAAVFTKVDCVKYKDVPDPEIAENEMLIKVKAAAICGTDSRIINGSKTKGIMMPAIIGHEVSGEVIRIGKDVTAFAIGDRVIIDPVLPCGECCYCLNDMENVCLNRKAIGYEYSGCFAEYLKIPAAFVTSGNVLKLKPETSWEAGALVEPLACVQEGQTKLNIGFGDTVVVIGAGPIGLMHVMLAKAQGATKVIVSEPTKSRREAAIKFGADILVDPINESLPDIVYANTEGFGADVVILAIGNPRVVNQSLQICKKGARVSMFAGFAKGAMPEVDVNLIHYNELCVVGSASLKRSGFKKCLELVECGAIDVQPLVTHTFKLEKFNDALALAESGDAIKVVIKP